MSGATWHRNGRKPLRKTQHNGVTATRCPVCGKLRYRTRKEAKLAASKHRDARMRVYRCGDFWHLTSVSMEEEMRFRGKHG